MLKNKNEEEELITTGSTLKFINCLRLRWYGHIERIKNQRIPKQITTATMTEKSNRKAT